VSVADRTLRQAASWTAPSALNHAFSPATNAAQSDKDESMTDNTHWSQRANDREQRPSPIRDVDLPVPPQVSEEDRRRARHILTGRTS
jgi:hypothetical protein